MPRFYFHLFNDETIQDNEGTQLPNAAVALQSAAGMARDMAAESVRNGRLTLHHRIEVVGDGGETIGSVYFRDVVQIHD